jgi:hypothetical protein
VITLPLTSDPCRTFTTAFGESRYRVTSRFNERSQVFTLDIANGDTDEFLVQAMPVLLGCDMLVGFKPSLGRMFAIDTGAEAGAGTNAGPEDLGGRIQVAWLAPGETLD